MIIDTSVFGIYMLSAHSGFKDSEIYTTPLIPVGTLQLVRNFANPYLITRTFAFTSNPIYIWESVLKILISLKMIQSLSSKSNNVLILLEKRERNEINFNWKCLLS